METKKARFERPEGIRFSPYDAGMKQVDSIEGVSELGDEQKKILYQLAMDLIILEDIGRPDNIEKMKGDPFSLNGIAQSFMGSGTLEDLVNTGKDALVMVRKAIECNIAFEIVGVILDRDSLEPISR